MLNDLVDFEIAKLLSNRLWAEDRYAAEDLETTTDYEVNVRKYQARELLSHDWENTKGKTFYAPTYADVLDWFRDAHKLVIEFHPAFTYALKEHVAYYYTVWRISDEHGKLEKIFEENMGMCSLGLVIKEVLKKMEA